MEGNYYAGIRMRFLLVYISCNEIFRNETKQIATEKVSPTKTLRCGQGVLVLHKYNTYIKRRLQ